MKTYSIEFEQFIDLPIEHVFNFFSKPDNLSVITPPRLNFKILTPTPLNMKEGLLIDYNLTISGKKYKYKLDSVIIRDTLKKHWGSVFTCNKEYYGFDGVSETMDSVLVETETINSTII